MECFEDKIVRRKRTTGFKNTSGVEKEYQKDL